MPTKLVFNDIPNSGRFTTPSGTVFQKTGVRYAKPIIDPNGKPVINGANTVAFYKSNIVLELL